MMIMINKTNLTSKTCPKLQLDNYWFTLLDHDFRQDVLKFAP